MAEKKGTQILIKAKQRNFFFNERKRAEIRSGECGYRNMMSTIELRMSTCFWKKSFYGMVCYAMLSYSMVWYGEYGMLWDLYAMLWDLYDMLWFMLLNINMAQLYLNMYLHCLDDVLYDAGDVQRLCSDQHRHQVLRPGHCPSLWILRVFLGRRRFYRRTDKLLCT